MKRRGTTQDISWFIDLRDNAQINLAPPYQRRSVWTRKDRLYFLDTIFNGYPCPAIFLHKTTNENGKSTYHVVDGKQRLETIFKFSGNNISMSKDHLDGELAGKKFRDLSKDYKQKFWDYVLAVDMLDIVEHSVVDEVFDRLNRNSRKLERQELRHAKFDGWLINYAEKQSELQEWKNLGIATTSRARRMKDVQFLSELMINTITKEAQGFSQDEIDEYYAEYDSPNEDVPNFDEQAFENHFSDLRDYLLLMDDHNQCINTYARNFMHFYTLWNLITKHEIELSADGLATKYADFMKECITIKKEQIIEDNDNPIMKYASNSVGANTEFPQRKARLEALESILP